MEYQTTTTSSYSYYTIQQSPPIPTSHPPHYQSIPYDYTYLPPPVSDPYANYGPYPVNYSGFETQPSYYSDPNAAVVPQTWVTKQAPPIKYSPAIQPVRKEPVASSSYDPPLNHNLAGQNSTGKVFKRKLTKHTESMGKVFKRKLTKHTESMGKVFKRKLKKRKVGSTLTGASQSVTCKLCKVECSNVQTYETHLSGKKHNKSLTKMYASSTVTGVPTVPADLESKKQKLLEGGTAAQSLRVCAICNVACNGEIAFADHLVGKKHLAQERALSARTSSNPIGDINTGTKSQKKMNKKTSIAEPAWCEVCKISCTSSEGLVTHRQGKKHKKNVEKLRCSISSVTTPASTSAPRISVDLSAAAVDNAELAKGSALNSEPGNNSARCEVCQISCTSNEGLVIHRQGKKHKKNLEKLGTSKISTTTTASTSAPATSIDLPTAAVDNAETVKGFMPESGLVKNTADVVKGSVAESELKVKKGARSMEPLDLDTKKRKVLESGTAVDAVKTCTVCNVVCNSETVFHSHLSGQKHAAMVTKAGLAAGKPVTNVPQ